MTFEERLQESGLLGPVTTQLPTWLHKCQLLEINCAPNLQTSEGDKVDENCSKRFSFNFNKELPGRNQNLLLQFDLMLQG